MSDNVATSSITRATSPKRALIIGGSLAGLFTGTLLLRAGWDVDVFERSPDDLDSRGGGIVLQPEVVEVFRRARVDLSTLTLGVTSQDRVVFQPDGSVLSRRLAPQTQTSWSLIYSTMRRAFGNRNYHQGRRLTGIRPQPNGCVTAIFDDGSEESGDLLVGADGGNSTVRQLLWSNSEPQYAGYLAWRGLVSEDDMPEVTLETLHGDFAFANNRESHILGYLVPGERNDTRPGHRFYNWVWYRTVDDVELRGVMTDVDGRYRGYSVPEGKLAPAWRERILRDADALLPPGFRAIVKATAQPFAQTIRDLSVDRMVKGRVVLIGDAASIPRPHTAASTSKAATNALALQTALLRLPDDVDRALASWEPEQAALGRYLHERGRQVGDHLLFGSTSAKPVG
ncbi:FAD binding domain-containing protein [Caballeronia sp. S22]|uniref:FAD binding domain-containing protein n=1 Tax=Caballeronia sp. S22 TaxID=3137182 RepID=UPI00353104D9